MSSNPIIEVQNVSKIYKLYDKPSDRFVEMVTRGNKSKIITSLDSVSFSVNKGETVGIIGRNGAGKSTILQIIAGTLMPTMGSVNVTGRVVALLELGAGFNMEYTGAENVYLYASILGLSKNEIKERYQQILDFSEIGEFINYPVKTYSSGMFVRLAFSVAINVSPEVLIVDEALSVGDVQFQHKCIAKLKELQSEGCTILFVSHDIDSVKSLCNSAILLHKGKKMQEGTPEEIASKYVELIHKEQLEKRKSVVSSGEKLYTANESIQWVRDDFSRAERHGDKEAEIIRLIIEDEKNLEVDSIVFGSKLKVKFLIEYNENITSEINIGILFRDEKGIDLYGDDSWNHGLTLPKASKNSRFIFSFDIPNIYLKPGSYSLTVALGAMNDEKTTWNDYYFDWIERAKVVSIRTKENTRVWSKILLPATAYLEEDK